MARWAPASPTALTMCDAAPLWVIGGLLFGLALATWLGHWEPWASAIVRLEMAGLRRELSMEHDLRISAEHKVELLRIRYGVEE